MDMVESGRSMMKAKMRTANGQIFYSRQIGAGQFGTFSIASVNSSH
jgi:hypothetical protein